MRKLYMYTACVRSMKVIKTTVSLKIDIKEKTTFLWFDLLLCTIIKNYISAEREINIEFDKANCGFIH